MRKYITPTEAAAKLSLTAQDIQDLCLEGRIPQATRIGSDWRVPENFRVLPVRRGSPVNNDPPKSR